MQLDRKIKNYAIALYEATKEIKEKDRLKKRVKNFLLILKKNNDLYLIEKIIKVYQNYYRKKKGISRIEITSADEIDEKILEGFKRKFKNLEIIKKIDKSLIGGIIIRKGDHIIDGSIKKRLKKIKEKFKTMSVQSDFL